MNKTIIIAEAGVNHNGSLDVAMALIDQAALAGVDYVKFQTFKAEKLVTNSAKKAEYQIQNTGNNDSQFQMLKKLELNEADHYLLKSHCDQVGIKFLSTAFDLESIDFLYELGIDFFKVPSGEITNYPYLRKIAQKGLPVVLSTGMCTLGDIEQAISVLKTYGLDHSQISILHCTTEYPTPMTDVNLNAMHAIRCAFQTEVGYSDHTKGIEVPIAAVALGARIIEKHFTLDRNMEGPDHIASLEPIELASMVRSIRNIEDAMGSGVKLPSISEQKNIAIARKSIVAGKCIMKGELFCENNLTIKRPGNGISPMRWCDIIGLEAKRDFEIDELIEL